MKGKSFHLRANIQDSVMMSLLQTLLLLLSSICMISEVSCQYSSRTEYSRQRYPVKDPVLCGQDRVDKSYVCDPDHILESQDKEANQLDKLIAQIVNETYCPCSAYSCENHREGYKIGVALIRKMEFDGDFKNEDDDLDEFEARKRKVVRNLQQAKLYAHEILNKWMLGRCDEAVVVFYSHEDNVVYTATGSIARMKLTNEIVATVAKDARRTGFYKSAFDGLWKIVNDYRSVFLNSYHPRMPKTGELTSANFGVSLVKGRASIIWTCVIILLSVIRMN